MSYDAIGKRGGTSPNRAAASRRTGSDPFKIGMGGGRQGESEMIQVGDKCASTLLITQ